MKHDAKISISRPSCSDGSKYISIRVYDTDAGIEFLELRIGYEEFTEAITGMGNTPCTMEVQGLNNVGKKIERGTIEFPLPSGGFARKQKAIIGAEKNCPEGWTPLLYFGSQNSFFYKDGITMARCQISRWVKK